MGMRTVIPGANTFRTQTASHNALFRAIHKARVTAVNLELGTVQVQLEKVPYTTEATMPLLGMSLPPSSTGNREADFKASSWGRYIPQIGDILLVGFGSDGTLLSLGYSALFYKGLAYKEESSEDTGGLNWGETIGKRMKPGDWDFKSARNSNLYLGDRAKLSSGPNSITVNKPTSDITMTSPLFIEKSAVSEFRFGAVRRRELPTDPEEKAIMSSRSTQAQESSTIIRWNNSTPTGGLLVESSMGDVIEDSVSGSALRTSSQSKPVRRYFTANDITGIITAYEESVDSMGNFEVASDLATNFTWDTILSSWEISNLSTKIESTSTIELTSDSTMTLTGNGGVVVDGSSIKLGGSNASQPFVLGNKWQEFANALVVAIVTHTHTSSAPTVETTTSASLVAQQANFTAKITAALSALIKGA